MLHDDLTPIDAIDRIQVRPDVGVLKAIGLNHAFESAVADLVDNSLDARSTRVLIRFVIRNGLAARLLVIDDGEGMDDRAIDGAMQLGLHNQDSDGALGHFGMGLKSATFSQASTLTVLSRSPAAAAVGRRMFRESKGGDFEVDVLDPAAVQGPLSLCLAAVDGPVAGTVVMWDQCRTFPTAEDRSVTRHYLDDKVLELRRHLGLVFHRLLGSRDLRIGIDVWDADTAESGLEFEVEPIDPFGYSRTGEPGYPKTLHASIGTRSIDLACHIWPGRSDSPLYRLHGKLVENFQGLYLYRNKRLLLAGGWGGVVHEHKSYRLARVAVDIEHHLDVFAMSMEKAGVQLLPDVVHAIEEAKALDGTTLRDYLDDAASAYKDSNARVRKRTPILPPGQGIHPRIKRAIERENTLLAGEEPLRIRWKPLSDEDFLDVDRPNRTLWLNARYRPAVLSGKTGGVNDAPLVKALLFLIFEDLFRGQAMGAKDKENLQVWNEILTAAAQTQQRDHSE